ncbi:MAG: hypothetical protein NZM12_01730 [Steroidobacteraceae bacterium]|nr:hypothetical protein [Steroidobacteraceae bacterium]MDW8259695.1 hypothetical protein [Gammaproteobacteria bacterium]
MKRLFLAGLFAMRLPRCAPAQDKPASAWTKGRLFSPELLLQHRAELQSTDAQRDALP